MLREQKRTALLVALLRDVSLLPIVVVSLGTITVSSQPLRATMRHRVGFSKQRNVGG